MFIKVSVLEPTKAIPFKLGDKNVAVKPHSVAFQQVVQDGMLVHESIKAQFPTRRHDDYINVFLFSCTQKGLAGVES